MTDKIKAICDLIEEKITDAKATARQIQSMNPSRLVDIQGYAWDSIAYRFEELLKEIKEITND